MGQDPSVFVDHSNFKKGRMRSIEGAAWSGHRVGAFNTTVQFTDGSSIICERRERPQIVIGIDGRPIAVVSAMTGCPKALGDANDVVGMEGNIEKDMIVSR